MQSSYIMEMIAAQSLRSSFEKGGDVKTKRENFIQFLQSMFDEYGLEKISKSNVTMFVEKGNIFSQCSLLYNKSRCSNLNIRFIRGS